MNGEVPPETVPRLNFPFAAPQVSLVIVVSIELGLVALFMITLPDDGDEHPSALDTENVYVPAEKPIIVMLLPVPLVIKPSGVRVNNQFPEAGKPLSIIVPVTFKQVG